VARGERLEHKPVARVGLQQTQVKAHGVTGFLGVVLLLLHGQGARVAVLAAVPRQLPRHPVVVVLVRALSGSQQSRFRTQVGSVPMVE